MDKSLVTNFSKLINADENQDNTNKPKVSYVYGQVVDIMSDGKVAVVNIDGSTIRCPMKSNVTVSVFSVQSATSKLKESISPWLMETVMVRHWLRAMDVMLCPRLLRTGRSVKLKPLDGESAPPPTCVSVKEISQV